MERTHISSMVSVYRMTRSDLEKLLQDLIDGLLVAKVDDRFVAEAEALEKRLYESFDHAVKRLALAARRGEPTVSLSDKSFDDLREVRIDTINLIQRLMNANLPLEL